jgi:hypothetical protein
MYRECCGSGRDQSVMDAIGSSTMEEGDEGKMTVERHWLIFR